MSRFKSYPVKDFSTSQKFLADDPSQVVRVTGQSMLDANIEAMKKSGKVVNSIDTLTEAIAGDYLSGIYLLVGGGTVTLDGDQAIYRVSDAGSGGIVMANGNELVLLFVANTPANIITPIDSVENIAGYTGTADDQQISLKGYAPGSTVGGGRFVYELLNKSLHNGIKYFSPTVPFVPNLSIYRSASGETDPSGTGVWVRLTEKLTIDSTGPDNSLIMSYGNPVTDIDALDISNKISLADRAPTRPDNKGFLANNLWRFNSDVFFSNRVSQNNWATWIKTNDYIGLSGDVIQSSAHGIYWLSKTVSDYAGQCINVTNETLATSTDIGFNSDGLLDTVALDKFLRASRGLINTWYDQSGNGNNLTSTGVNRPTISNTAKVGNLRAIIFESPVIYNYTVTPDQYLTIPIAVTGNTNDVSVSVLASFASTTQDCPLIELDGNDGNYTAFGKRDQTGANGMACYQNTTRTVLTDDQPAVKDNFMTMAIGAANINYYGNDTDFGNGASDPAVVYVGGKVGTTTNIFVDGGATPQNGGAQMSGLIIYDGELSLAVNRVLHRSIVKYNKLVPQKRGQLIFDGDSITEGAYAEWFDSYPKVVSDDFLIDTKTYQVAKSGGTAATQYASLAKWEDSIFDSSAPWNIITLAVGTNDIGSGLTASQIYTTIESYVSDVRATGYDCVLATVLPRSSFEGNGFDVVREEFNQLLRDGWQGLGCLGLVDYDDEGTMGSYAFVNNTTYYEDGTHPTTLGYALLANFVTDTMINVVRNKLYNY